jgi:hypothetical protein
MWLAMLLPLVLDGILHARFKTSSVFSASVFGEGLGGNMNMYGPSSPVRTPHSGAGGRLWLITGTGQRHCVCVVGTALYNITPRSTVLNSQQGSVL